MRGIFVLMAALCLVTMVALWNAGAQPPGIMPGVGGMVQGSGQGSGQGPRPGPPQEAIDACSGLEPGADCTVGPDQGQCLEMPGDILACVPQDRIQTTGPKGNGQSKAGPPAMGPGQPGAGMPGNGHAKNGPGGGLGGRKPFNSYPDPGEDLDLAARNATATMARVPDTAQEFCFDNTRVMACPEPGRKFYGQDAQYDGPGPSYRDNGDGTATDLVTGLVWETAHHADRLQYYPAKTYCESLNLAGHDDWRLPSVKELYSLILFDGKTGGKPFLYDKIFQIEPPGWDELGHDTGGTHFPDMMGQTWTSTIYAGRLWDLPHEAAFFVNFLDGRIKCAPTRAPNGMFYRCVRGPAWGVNDFRANGDGTVTDRALGLMWQQADNGQGVEWAEALAYCQNLELAGHGDWRLPNVKELETLVDYSRPEPAIDTDHFRITDPEAWFWSATTHGERLTDADYVCFGKCDSAEGVDVHGAGAQRSDPKAMSLKKEESRGGQNDDVRVLNYARCVRDAE